MKRTKIVKRTEQICRVYGNRVYFFSKLQLNIYRYENNKRTNKEFI